LSNDPASPWFSRTVGDPRPEHRLAVVREETDLALRFFPRVRDGVATRYLGISTREVHYLGPRAAVQMFLARHSYRCRINNPRVQAIWDVALNAPVAFQRDDRGVAFTVQVASGYVTMLAISETPAVELFPAAPFPGRDRQETMAALGRLAGGRQPPRVVDLTPSELAGWAKELPAPVVISYGAPGNRAAADKLAAFLQTKFGKAPVVTNQLATVPAAMDQPVAKDYEKAVVLIGDEWTNNDLGLHGAYWGAAYGAHLPFTATYSWPGPGRAVVALSRPYALTVDGNVPFMAVHGLELRRVKPEWLLLRRKLYIAANGADALAAVETIIKQLSK
jgi:peptidoglycan hydrolase-like protein with peptidoglycan-binding domain